METNKLATLVVTSMLAVLAAGVETPNQEYTDRNICESQQNSASDLRTCNQCNIPVPRGEK